MIHKQLEAVDMEILHYLMRNPVWNATIEYNDNRLSLYSAQMGKCAVTGAKLMIGDIFCHHKVPRCNGGTDAYQNLICYAEMPTGLFTLPIPTLLKGLRIP